MSSHIYKYESNKTIITSKIDNMTVFFMQQDVFIDIERESFVIAYSPVYFISYYFLQQKINSKFSCLITLLIHTYLTLLHMQSSMSVIKNVTYNDEPK